MTVFIMPCHWPVAINVRRAVIERATFLDVSQRVRRRAVNIALMEIRDGGSASWAVHVACRYLKQYKDEHASWGGA